MFIKLDVVKCVRNYVSVIDFGSTSYCCLTLRIHCSSNRFVSTGLFVARLSILATKHTYMCNNYVLFSIFFAATKCFKWMKNVVDWMSLGQLILILSEMRNSKMRSFWAMNQNANNTRAPVSTFLFCAYLYSSFFWGQREIPNERKKKKI